MNAWTLLGGLVFGGIGFVAFAYGKRRMDVRRMALGAALMGFPYFISNAWLLFAIGAALTAAAFLWRD